MHCFIVNVGAEGACDVPAIALRFPHLTEMLLFVGDVMLCARNDALALNTLDRGSDESTSQVWIRAKAFLLLCQQPSRGSN